MVDTQVQGLCYGQVSYMLLAHACKNVRLQIQMYVTCENIQLGEFFPTPDASTLPLLKRWGLKTWRSLQYAESTEWLTVIIADCNDDHHYNGQ